MLETWRKNLDKNLFIAVFFLDFRKAFDSLNHNVINKKLIACGVTGDMHQWLMNYLANRQQNTTVNGQTSEYENVDTCALQGSLLGPRLFSITANDLPD